MQEVKRIFGALVAPATGVVRDVYINETSETLWIWKGGAWVLVHAGSFSGVPQSAITLANGANNDVAVTSGWVDIGGPTAAYSITGVAGGVDGRIVTFINSPAQALTIKHLSTSAVGNQILGPGGADLVLASHWRTVTLQYGAAVGFWYVIAYT